MFTSLLITPMMLAVTQPMVEVPSTLVYDHQSQTTVGMLSSQSALLLAGTLCTSTGTGKSGCQFDGSCTDSDTDGDC
jgi:hypothetical protein